MKNYNRAFYVIALTVVLLLAARVSSAQTEITKTIRFPAGRNSTILSGKLPKSDMTHVYILRAAKGQRIKLGITFTGSGDAEFSFKLPNGKNVDEDSIINTEWEGILPQTGNYQIRVFNPSKIRGMTNYALKISLVR
ncbi:MAG TPA: hypothetical protein VF599_00875 [Pyrinomonadaceae bacterium]|jgi:hypothetical protein